LPHLLALQRETLLHLAVAVVEQMGAALLLAGLVVVVF
tara:strand:- start:363 stop:476 length:114 start_codon:yes stop_codon:yes gene_type:complete